MKSKRHRYSNWIGILLSVAFFCGVAGCDFSSARIEFKRGKKAEEKGRFDDAVSHFRKVVGRSPESEVSIDAAREAARISLFQTKNFKDAIHFYGYLVSYSGDEKERREAQEKIASIYFEKLSDFPKSIEEYNRLLLLHNTTNEMVNYRFQLAKAHFNLTQFTEAKTEALEAAKLVEKDDPRRFEIMMFLASIYFNTKKVDEAIKIYHDLLAAYPDRAAKENVAMNIIVCHEELEQFDQAIESLRALRPQYSDPEFIDLKIKRLQARKANMPGSRGLRK